MIHPSKAITYQSVLSKIDQDAKEWLPKDLESGGYLLGKIHLPNYILEVTHFIDGGPKAERTPVSFSGDPEYATKVKEKIRSENPQIRLVGEYHLHPWNGAPQPSGGDLGQLKKLKNGIRSWYVILLKTKDGFAFWDLNNENNEFVKVPHQVLRLPERTDLSREQLLDRVLEVTQDKTLAKKTVAIIGIGSGGSVIAKYLAVTGIRRIILVDNDCLELVNVIRHEGTLEDIGKPKTEICKEIIEAHNPFTIVEPYQFDALEDKEKLSELTSRSNLVVSSSGSAKLNNLVNRICLQLSIPAIYGGVFRKATGGYVLPVLPKEMACFNCLFDLTSKSYHVDKDAAEAYGIPVEELHAQQGLWIDISIPALRTAKIALRMLQGETGFLKNWNFILYKESFIPQKIRMRKREDCYVCNFEEWVQSKEKQPEISESVEKHEPDRFSILKKVFRGVFGHGEKQ